MVQRPLVGIMQTLGSGITVIADTPNPPPSDCQCPLMSLPYTFGTKLDTIPAHIPYLAAESQRVLEWRQRLGPTGFKIGVCWYGSGLPAAVGKPFPIALLASIARLADVRLISLQKGLGVEQLNHLPQGMRVEELGPDFDNDRRNRTGSDLSRSKIAYSARSRKSIHNPRRGKPAAGD